MTTDAKGTMGHGTHAAGCLECENELREQLAAAHAEAVALREREAALTAALRELYEASRKHEKADLWNSHWQRMWAAADRALSGQPPAQTVEKGQTS